MITEEINLKLFNHKVKEVETPNILIAGCGTGQQSLDAAARFRNSTVLAVDLSLSSLSYAKRKTEELGFSNITYMQADILDLYKLKKQFDIIECGGVLHHMNDPMAGWKVLVNCLKPGGLMYIGLYSEIARKQIVKIRKEIDRLGIGSTDEAMKSFRCNMINSKNNNKTILSFTDFYSLSSLRDLLFHIQEHRFTIPLIKKYLDELSLKFCGFESNDIVEKFKLINTGQNDSYNLEKWNVFENANPQTFLGMYQFWCQKL